MKLFKQPDLEAYYNDERIKYEQYRISHYAFIAVAVLFMSAMAVALFFWDEQVPIWIAASVVLAILMVGFWIVVIMSWRSGLYEAWREMVNRNPKTRRRKKLDVLFNVLGFGVWMGVCDYFLLSDGMGVTPSVCHSLLMGAVDGVLFGAGMYWLQMRKVRKADDAR